MKYFEVLPRVIVLMIRVIRLQYYCESKQSSPHKISTWLSSLSGPALNSVLCSDGLWGTRWWGSQWSGWWRLTQRTTSPRWAKQHDYNTKCADLTTSDLHRRKGSDSFVLSSRLKRWWRMRWSKWCFCRQRRWGRVWLSTLVEQAEETAASNKQFQTLSFDDCWEICSP